MDMGQIGANPPGSDIYVNEPHISGGVPILSKTDESVRYHEHDFPGTTLWSTDTKGAVPLPLRGKPLTPLLFANRLFPPS